MEFGLRRRNEPKESALRSGIDGIEPIQSGGLFPKSISTERSSPRPSDMPELEKIEKDKPRMAEDLSAEECGIEEEEYGGVVGKTHSQQPGNLNVRNNNGDKPFVFTGEP